MFCNAAARTSPAKARFHPDFILCGKLSSRAFLAQESAELKIPSENADITHLPFGTQEEHCP